MTITKLLICDDHAVVRAGLRMILETQADFEIVAEVADGREAIEWARESHPDIVIMDLSMPTLAGIDAIRAVQEAAPDAKVMVFTVHGDEAHFSRALQAGAEGYILKGASPTEILAALRLVAEGGVAIPQALRRSLWLDRQGPTHDSSVDTEARLTDHEREVLRLIAVGRTNREIAEHMSFSVRSIERLRSSIMSKLGLQSRAELMSYAIRHTIAD